MTRLGTALDKAAAHRAQTDELAADVSTAESRVDADTLPGGWGFDTPETAAAADPVAPAAASRLLTAEPMPPSVEPVLAMEPAPALEPTPAPEPAPAVEPAPTGEPVPAVNAAPADTTSEHDAGSSSPYRFSVAARDKVVVGAKAEAGVVEQYRRLAASLHHAQIQKGIRTIMVASAVAAEGKTLTATNLALTLSHSYRRKVLLIDADLRRPSVHDVLQLPNEVGLGDRLRNVDGGGGLPVCAVSPTFWAITAGRPDSDPMSGLVSETMKQLLVEAAECFDWVIVDTPPVAVLSDANLLAAMVDAALLVVSAETTPYPIVKRAIEAIGAPRILGVVLNRASKSDLEVGYHYYDYHYRRRNPGIKPTEVTLPRKQKR